MVLDRGATVSGGALAVGDVRVKIDGADLPAKAYADLLEVTVHEDIEAPSMFTLRLGTWDDGALAMTWADDTLFTPGKSAEVSLGYTGALAPVMKGEITGLEIEAASGEPAALIVRGYDRRHRLQRGARTRSFVNMKDSDIAAQIAREQRLSPAVADTQVTLEYVLQHARSDLDFLTERAAAIGFEVVVEDKTLHFRPHKISERATVSLAMDRDVVEMSVRMSTRGQVGEAVVRGWDPRTKRAIVAKADASSSAAMGATLGAKAANDAFGSAAMAVVDRAPSTQAEAERIARGQVENAALGFLRGEGVAFGRTDLRAGIVIAIDGLGDRFSGAYYVASATHAYSQKRGYRVSFTVWRNAT